MKLIELYFLLTFLTILINLIKINSKNKILINLLASFILIIKISESFDLFAVNVFAYLCFLYILLNIYTTRYSSIRISLMNSIIKKKKIFSEEKLLKDRMKRFKKTNESIMGYNLFYVTDKLVGIFRKFLLK